MSPLSALVVGLSVISTLATGDVAATKSTSATSSSKVDLKGFLNPNDPVAISFWIISIAMVASTVFFLMESTSVSYHWKTSLNVGSLVTLVAAVHYFYMREFWVQIGTSPIVYRYIDWSITVPLQMVEFYLILAAVQPNISAGMFWRLLLGTVTMLAFGYAGEAGMVNAWAGFGFGMAGWGFILYEIFIGEAGSVAAGDERVNKHVKTSFNTMRFIVTVGWSIYPLGYFFGYLMGSVQDSSLNLVYNLADFVNKIGFCLAIWSSAKASTIEQEHKRRVGQVKVAVKEAVAGAAGDPREEALVVEAALTEAAKEVLRGRLNGVSTSLGN